MEHLLDISAIAFCVRALRFPHSMRACGSWQLTLITRLVIWAGDTRFPEPRPQAFGDATCRPSSSRIQ